MFEGRSMQETCRITETDIKTGLSSTQAVERLGKNGPNELAEEKRKSKIVIFLTQLNDPMIFILLLAAGISLWHHEPADAGIIFAVVLLNAIIGMTQESRAEAALEALRQISSPYALVRRDGKQMEVPAKDLVIGDLVILEVGRIIPADLRLTSSIHLKIEESALTGESVPVEKDASFVAQAELGIGDRLNMAYASTSVAYGRGEGVVIATAMETEIGKIARILSATENDITPLQKRLADLGKWLGGFAVVLCALMLGIAVLQQRDFTEMMLTAISLAVAAVPEGLPAVVTIVLALGVQRMVTQNAIVRRLPSVETLGAVSVVCSDKTGTLTQNKMAVVQVYHNEVLTNVSSLDPQNDAAFIKGFVLCNDASIADNIRIGDPTELALIDMGAALGLTREILESTMPRINEQAFDSNRKLMTTVHRRYDEQAIAFTKGAMDNILARSESILVRGQVRPITEEDKTRIVTAARQMAQSALRVLGLAIKENDTEATEQGLTFVGLVGMIDPPRPEAKAAVETLKTAGIRTVMITGDHVDTALAIAKELGIAQDESQCLIGERLSRMTQEELNAVVNDMRVFARVSPEHKVMIVQALKAHGHIVSMTGDGVNDAPSLKAADIGVAMGITGTDVAKGASDMVLTDDNFASIEKAVKEGRTIYANIRKTVLFLLSANFGEALAMFTAIAAGLAVPLKAIHILWINLITDTLPALALGVDPSERDMMQAPPRSPKESLFARGGTFLVVFYGFIVAGVTLIAFLLPPLRHGGWNLEAIRIYLNDPQHLQTAQTYAFVTLGMSQLFHAIGMRSLGRSVFRINHLTNPTMLLAFGVGLILQVAVTEIPFMTAIFGTERLSLLEWLQLLALAIAPLLAHEIVVPLRRSIRGK